MLNKAQTEALEVFVAYFTKDSPYEDMQRIDYLLLHEYFQQLPPQVFTKQRIRHLWHLSKHSAKIDTLRTESGIVSCTTSRGLERVTLNLDIRHNDCKFKIEPPMQVVSASKLLKFAHKHGIDTYEDVIRRAENEKEYVVLLEGLRYRLVGRLCVYKGRFVN